MKGAKERVGINNNPEQDNNAQPGKISIPVFFQLFSRLLVLLTEILFGLSFFRWH
jgi:hypothetical protein